MPVHNRRLLLHAGAALSTNAAHSADWYKPRRLGQKASLRGRRGLLAPPKAPFHVLSPNGWLDRSEIQHCWHLRHRYFNLDVFLSRQLMPELTAVVAKRTVWRQCSALTVRGTYLLDMWHAAWAMM